MLARVFNKKFGLCQLLILVVLSLSLSTGAVQNGCMTTTQKGAVVGTGVGAALGAGIGALTGNPGWGAVIGAGAGALGGALLGDQLSGNDNGDVERMKRLSGFIMTADELNKNLAFIGVSSELKNAIMVDVRTITQGFPGAKFMVNMNGQVQRAS